MPSPAPKTVVSMETAKRNEKWVSQLANEQHQSFSNDLHALSFDFFREFPTTQLTQSFETVTRKFLSLQGEIIQFQF